MTTEPQNMNGTHEQTGVGWHGFNLDGTLAVYKGWEGIDHIGEPVKPMVNRIKMLHKEGKVVKIVTPRVAPKAVTETKPNPYCDAYRKNFEDGDVILRTIKRCPWITKSEWTAIDFVRDWCDNHLGFVPEITHETDSLMLELYSCCVKQVFPNEGTLVEDVLHDVKKSCKEWSDKFFYVNSDLSNTKGDYYRLLSDKHRVFTWFLVGVVTLANALAAITNVTKVLITK